MSRDAWRKIVLQTVMACDKSPYHLRREKALDFSGCNSRPGTGSFHPVAIETAAPAGDTIGGTDVLSTARSGEGADVGVALSIFPGPVVGIFRGSLPLTVVGVLLLAIVVLQYRRLRLGSFGGVLWTLGVVILLLVAMARMNVSYSL